MTEEQVIEAIRTEAYKVSRGNTFYDWDLMNDAILAGQAEMKDWTTMALGHRLKPEHYTTALYRYFQVVYDETFKQWRKQRDNFATAFILEALEKESNAWTPPIHDIIIKTKEIAFIQERFNNWIYLDNEWDDYVFDNKSLGEVDYSWIVIDTTVRNENYKLTFGKYKGETIHDMFTLKPDYLLWLHTNVERFKLSDELLTEVKEWIEHFARDGRYD